MADSRSEQQEDVRFRILRLLEENPELSQRELADAVGIGLSSVNYCLRAFIEKGLIKLSNFTTAPDKRRYAYILTPKGASEKATLSRRFLLRKMAEFEALAAEIETLQAEMSSDANLEQKQGVQQQPRTQ